MTFGESHKLILDAVGHGLVIGGPGSGKTTLAIVKAQNEIEKKLRQDQQVLFLSLSRAAIFRVAQSAKGLLPKETLRRVSMQTFHSFFWEILRTHGYLLGAPKKLTLLAPHDEKAMSNGIDDKHENWGEWVRKRDQLFSERGQTAFDLFAPKARRLLESAQTLRTIIGKKYPLIIIDEAQDTSSDQWSTIKLLSQNSTLLCLADLEQQIYDFLPGVGSERIEEIERDLQPTKVDLGSENNRSPGTEIVNFANDVLNSTPRVGKYKSVIQLNYQPKAEKRDLAIRRSVGMMFNKINELSIPSPSIAVLASWESGATIISKALRGGEKEIPHRLLFDEAATLLASRFIAFLLEPKLPERERRDLITGLTLIAAKYRAKGTGGALKTSANIDLMIVGIEAEQKLSSKLVKYLQVLIKTFQQFLLIGDPAKDWMFIRNQLKSSGCKELVELESDVSLLMAFNRGRRIYSGLQASWLENNQQYLNAREILDSALAEDILLSDNEDIRGLQVMTIHKSKGKQFDGVIIYRDDRRSPFVWPSDNPPYKRSRRILRVGVTRAKSFVMILNDVYSKCEILNRFSL
jgi:DNA helicase-2/ATP-dependent DNA helicase PcrA